jgi:glycosyltransferase involved in cell wall biosynthesis
MYEASSKTLLRVFIVPECQKGFVGGIQQYVFGHAISTHKEDYIDLLLCLTPAKDLNKCLDRVYNHNDIYCIPLYTPSHFHALINVLKIMIRISKYKKKVVIHSPTHIYFLVLALLRFKQVLYLLQEPKSYLLSLIIHSILSGFDNVWYLASDVSISTMYKYAIRKNINIFFPDFNKVFTSFCDELPEELKATDTKLRNASLTITYVGYLEYPRFSIPHFIVFLKLLKSLAERRGKNPLVILVIRPTKYSDKLMKYFTNKLKSLQLIDHVIAINRFLTVEEKLAVLKRSSMGLYFLLDTPTITQNPTIPPITIAEYIALGKPVVFFINGSDKLRMLGNLYTETKSRKYIHIIDISNDNYISEIRKVIEYILAS